MTKVAILVNHSIPVFELGCALEVFALPRSDDDSWYDTEVVTFEQKVLSGAGGLTVNAKQIDNLQSYDMLIVPGWDTNSKKIKLGIAEQIVAFYEQGKRIVSFCSGSFLIAQLGLLNGVKATTHWRYANKFQQRFSQVKYVDNVLYTQSDTLFCSAGSAAGLDLALEIVRQDFGHERANQVARRLVISPHRSGGQAQYVETPMPESNSVFSNTLDWALQRLDNALVVDDLAEQANMSRRSFDRHFRATIGMSPKVWLNQQRVHRAKQILEKENVNMEKLARIVGFDNAITLRFNFNKYVGISPSQYQAQFSASLQ